MDGREVLENIRDYLLTEQENLLVSSCNNISETNLAVAAVSRLGLIYELLTMIENVLEANTE